MNLVPTSVNPSGLTELIRNLGRDCLPTQYVREYTKNGIEACQRTGDMDAKVIVDYDRSLYAKSGNKLWKICFIDTGDGMSEAQMVKLLNSLSASGESTNEHKNYGVGAKIAALTRNHAGIIYESWKDGIGHRVFIRYDQEKDLYGIERKEHNGAFLECVPINECTEPEIEAKGHGTKVTLMGMEFEQDTMLPPESLGGIRESWLLLYLNSRFFEIPAGITLHARIGYYRDDNPKHNYRYNVSGQKVNLNNKSELFGERQLHGAKLYWWVMPKNVQGHGRELVKGHTALVNQGEIFDISDGRSNRITFFGVVFGRDRVIIYLEPENVIQNTARTGLVNPDGSQIIWHEWCDEFRNNIPDDLKQWLLQQELEYAAENHTESIKERLKGLKDLFKLGRYKLNPSGGSSVNPDMQEDHFTAFEKEGDSKDDPTPKGESGDGSAPGDVLEKLFSETVEKDKGLPASQVTPDPFPKVTWVRASDGNEGLTDRAAEYLPQQHQVLANSEFQGVRDVVEHLLKGYKDLPETRSIIEDEVRFAFEQILTECVAGAVSLKNRKHWDANQAEAAVSREALTSAVMPRYWMIGHLNRVLAAKIKAYSTE